jgi:hypothetical protein
MSKKPDVMCDEDMAALDQQLKSLIERSGASGLSASVIQQGLGDVALVRCGILVARQQLNVIGGGGSLPYVFVISPNPKVIAKLRAEGRLGDEELRQWLLKRIEKIPTLTTASLARYEMVGCSRTGLDAYLRGLYFLPREHGGVGGDPATSKLEQKIRRYRERVEQR